MLEQPGTSPNAPPLDANSPDSGRQDRGRSQRIEKVAVLRVRRDHSASHSNRLLILVRGEVPIRRNTRVRMRLGKYPGARVPDPHIPAHPATQSYRQHRFRRALPVAHGFKHLDIFPILPSREGILIVL